MNGNRKSILLVEDNPDDEELTRLAFAETQADCELVIARDGEEALDYLFGRGKHEGRDVCAQPGLILLDLNLPRVGGLEVLRRIRAEELTRFLPVAVLTTSREESDMTKSYALGANSYIPKPVDFTRFTDAVRKISLYWLTLNETPLPACCK